jgi:hypothetical protein
MKLLQPFDTYLFAAAPATRPALLRVLLGIYSFLYLSRRYRMLMKIAKSDPTLFAPVGAVSYLHRPVSPALFRKIVVATLVANVAFIFGIGHRVTGPIYAGLLLWVLSYRNSWSMIYHSNNVMVLHALILGLSPAADALSVDALRRTLQDRPEQHAANHSCDWRYGWPVQLMNLVTTLTYFLSAVAKIKGPLGLKWATGETLRRQIANDAIRKEVLGSESAPLAYTLYKQTELFNILAVGSLIVEAIAPAVLIDKRLARLWALAAFGMHWGIYALMKITFRYPMSGMLFMPFFEVERLSELLNYLEDKA